MAKIATMLFRLRLTLVIGMDSLGVIVVELPANYSLR
jgi:hypothetical protein